MADDVTEGRLRELLSDPGWSLPSWPDAEARVRRAARRQRIRAAWVAAGASAVAAAIVVATVTGFALPSRPVPGGADAQFRLPAVGAPGFPARVYPGPVGRPIFSFAGHCPNPVGLEAPPAAMRAQALAVLRRLGRSFSADLRLSDRTYWPQLQTNWQDGDERRAPTTPHVLYSASLDAYHHADAPPDLSPAIRHVCGIRTARDTWLVVTGAARNPAQQSEFLLLDRDGQVLLWNAE